MVSPSDWKHYIKTRLKPYKERPRVRVTSFIIIISDFFVALKCLILTQLLRSWRLQKHSSTDGVKRMLFFCCTAVLESVIRTEAGYREAATCCMAQGLLKATFLPLAAA